MQKRFYLPFILGTLSTSLSMAQTLTTPPELAASDAKLAVAVDSLVQQKCARDDFSGAVLIARQGRIVVESVCGEASKRYHANNNLDTKFNIASVGKMFTAIAIAQLVETGKVSYNDKVSKFVDASWLPAKVTNQLTIAQLLNHTSGLPEFLNTSNARNRSRALYRELVDMKPLLEGISPAFQPGTRYAYSNTGYLLLGVIIERASGENYFDYVRKHIFKVAGMNDSDSYALDELVENLATPYMMAQPPRRRDATFEGVLRGSAFGCGYSTVRDLLRFNEALKKGSLLKPASLQALWQNQLPEATEKGGGYGYGFELRTSKAGRIVGHSGQFPGIAANFDFYPDQDQVMILLSNYDPESSLHSKIEDLMTQGVR